ncbi:TfoX/Sxy family protein [candidate division KSB1 bacterium]|nr:TfoX/Sxy family protein [candidate division KSB1 bacterium]
MPISDSYLDYIMERLAVLGKVHCRKMFGGAGIMVPVRGELKPAMFAIIDDDTLYFKADDTNRADYTVRGLSQWVYDPSKPEKSRMPYFPVPADVLEDDDLLREWGQKAISVARNRRSARKPSPSLKPAPNRAKSPATKPKTKPRKP